ncbi:unnamed protein product [Hermetia illucens]|uniref:Uncharacterized protein n=1 Tax=Hermetia illucens TaxID=343691 RepID=A0A7R8UHT7_HERIL|nr:pinin isoform X1 [Hermetia illucens]XP_037904245.1 pinin isoform X1 [Hermetia illucens]CAD7080829.1 unnamed protein product [Hermetia illucens]
MTEKDLDSMATVQMKQEYAPSEVYSTASEPPPAYKRRSNSVQIAKICAFTVIVSSFVIGSFILASAYLQARASCDQMQALDSVLEKELMLETMQQVNKELPRAEALLGKEADDSDLQSIDREEEPVKKEEKPEQEAIPSSNSESDSDSSFSDSDESDDLQKNHYKVPLELDLSDLAAALLENNQKSRMNCVIERKHAVELVDSPARSMQLPFGVNLTTDPKKQRITGERISISCDSGSDDEKRENTEDAENIRPIFVPLQRMPIPFGPQPQQIPLTHMPQRMAPPQPMMHQMPPPFQQIQMRPPIPPQFMQAPRPEPQVRIHVQRIPIRDLPIPQEIQEEIMGENKDYAPQEQHQMPQIQVQRVPLGLALQRAGITADDLRNIQRMAEERITEELRHLAAEESASNSENSDSSEEDDSQSNDQSNPTQQPPEPQLSLHPPMQEPQILQMGRAAYGRSLPTPVRIPVPMMQPQELPHISSEQESAEPERPHYVQPRSVRSVDNVFLHREKRVKRCACDCSC